MKKEEIKKQSDVEVEERSSNDGSISEFQKFRVFKNHKIKLLFQINLILIPLIGILYILRVHQHLGIALYSAQYIGLFLALILSAVFLSIPAHKKAPKDRVPWYDWLLALLGLFIGMYLLIYYPKIVMQMGNVTTSRFIISILAVIVIMEALRRSTGWILFTIVAFFLGYGFFGPYMPGVFKGAEIEPAQFFNYVYLDPSSLINLMNLAATIGLCFLLFGQVLLEFKGDKHFNNYALSLFGRFRGGPAKGSVVGSSLVGTITGGSVTNVMLTGSVTIPLMKKNGYTSAQAGAIEAVSSSGGQIMPPVMGIVAFMIAENLGIPYTEVALAALLPAILFYLTVFFQVDLIAARNGLKGMSREVIPSLKETFKRGWMIIPIMFILIYFLFIKGFTPSLSALYAALFAAVILIAFQKDVRNNLIKSFLNIFIETGKMIVDLSIVIGGAGLIVGITGVTGLSFNLGYMLSSFAEYGLFILLITCAIFSIILGMGMPSVAAYAMVAVLIAPTLVEMGVDPLSAHLFVFYFSIVSNFTPPIALASFAAGPIAKESPNKISIQAMGLGVVSYIIPFLFVYEPELLLRMESANTWQEILLNIGTAIIGCYLVSIAVQGFFTQKLHFLKRVLVSVFALLMFIPITVWEYSWILNSIGFVFALIFVLLEWVKSRKSQALYTEKESLT